MIQSPRPRRSAIPALSIMLSARLAAEEQVWLDRIVGREQLADMTHGDL
jgi:hypothetical protein